MKTIGIILKKELRRYFTDYRMILGLVLPGILIFALYSLMGTFIQNNANTTITEYNVAYINQESDDFYSIPSPEGLTINIITVANKEDALDKIANKELDVLVEYEADFYNKMTNYSTSPTEKAPEVKIYYNSTNDSSSSAFAYYQAMLNAKEAAISNKFDINASAEKFDLAKKEDVTMQILTNMLPFLLIIFLFSGCMGICCESIAGEKERGTIATLLVTPAKRSDIAIGKVIALSITSLVSATTSFLGLICSLDKLVGSDNITLSAYSFGTYANLFLVIISTVLIFVIILTLISTFAKTVKEASSFAVIVNVLVMVVGVTTFMSTSAQTNPAVYFIPAYNSVQCLTGILSNTINPLNLVITICSNLIYTGIGIFALTKMFNSEKVMFNK